MKKILFFVLSCNLLSNCLFGSDVWHEHNAQQLPHDNKRVIYNDGGLLSDAEYCFLREKNFIVDDEDIANNPSLYFHILNSYMREGYSQQEEHLADAMSVAYDSIRNIMLRADNSYLFDSRDARLTDLKNVVLQSYGIYNPDNGKTNIAVIDEYCCHVHGNVFSLVPALN